MVTRKGGREKQREESGDRLETEAGSVQGQHKPVAPTEGNQTIRFLNFGI